ncbi:MAG TPA: trehalose-phosphatase, partial [Anaerolineae bacterium]|nr:trehalose-phosphatase [Anaerolineae bacterium]
MDLAQGVDHLLLAQPLALATDFDGTISEIAPTPELASVHPRCRDLLAQLTHKLPLVAVLSGRPAVEVRRLTGIGGVVYLGNHGLEWWQDGTSHIEPSVSKDLAMIRSILEAAQRALNLPGLAFEDKGAGASIHYRLTEDPVQARDEVLAVLHDLTRGTGVRVVEGRRVVELRPSVRVDKGTALFGLLRRHPVRAAVYAGDDLTDVDAFEGMRRW